MNAQRSTRIIAVANQKGGVGKTTTCVNLGAALVEEGKKVLLIDNDPQGNLTSYLSKMAPNPGKAASLSSIPERITREKSTIDELYLLKRPPLRDNVEDQFLRSYMIGLDYIAAETSLSGVEYYLYTRPDKEMTLKRNLQWAMGVYDYIIIDNPPSINLLTLNALCAATDVLIPLQAEFFSLEGISKMQATIADVRARWNPMLRICGLLPTQVDQRKKLTTEVMETLKSYFPEELFVTQIRDNTKIAESSGHGLTIFKYASRSPGAQDYRDLATELLGRA